MGKSINIIVINRDLLLRECPPVESSRATVDNALMHRFGSFYSSQRAYLRRVDYLV